MLNLPIRLNLQPDVDPEKIAEAIGAAVRAHPVLQGTVEKENGEWVSSLSAGNARFLPCGEDDG